MSSTPTPGESEPDNSSSANNQSSLLAEKGTADDDLDTSSIEALNWSEADEEELLLQQRQQSRIATASPKGTAAAATVAEATSTTTSSLPEKVASDLLKSDESLGETLTSSGENVEYNGRLLSSSLLQSISSTTVSDDCTKKSVIENWASDVNQASERGEMEIQEETEPEEEDGDDDEDTVNVDEDKGIGIRKRRKLFEGPMSMSFTSDTGFDPLSNAPVLDDGPIWNKGPKRYRFQENRRINQKLTFGVLLAVVLAIGLGLGNLVAYNECETEYKANQNQKHEELESKVVKSISNKENKELPVPLPQTESTSATTTDKAKNKIEDLDTLEMDKIDTVKSPSAQTTSNSRKSETKDPEAKLDPRYTLHMETLSKIVKKLDYLQRKIDKFQNTTRQLGGVIMLKDAEEDEEDFAAGKPDSENKSETLPTKSEPEPAPEVDSKPSLYDEQVHPEPQDLQNFQTVVNPPDENDDESSISTEAEEDEEDFSTLELIDGIEETINYIRRQQDLKYFKSRQRQTSHKNLEQDSEDENSLSLDEELTILASVEAINQAREEFIRKERDELREKKILGLADERQPEDYSREERTEIRKKYDNFMSDYPLKAEMETIKERLKFQNRNDIDINPGEFDDIQGFFERYIEVPLKHDDDEPTMPQPQGPQDVSPEGQDLPTLPKLPKRSLIETLTPKSDKNPNPPKLKGDDEEDNQGSQEYGPKQFQREKSPKEYPKTEKRSKSKKFKSLKPKNENEDVDNFGSGSGSGNGQRQKREDRKKKHSKDSKQNDDYHKNRSKSNYRDHQEDKENSGSGDRDHRKKYRSKDDFNEYNKNKDPKKWRDFDNFDLDSFDYDEDDDDHKRKKYSSNFNKVDDHHYPQGQNQQQEQDTNWLLERTKAREEFRNDFGSKSKSKYYQHQHSSSGKKANNWQMERDRVREKFRNKNHKNKSGSF